ncbi:MAG: lysophospholipid acyltransferase family protein [Myxococcota bacterium]
MLIKRQGPGAAEGRAGPGERGRGSAAPPPPADSRVRALIGLLVLPVALLLHSLAVYLEVLLGAGPRRLQRYYLGFARLCMRVGGTRLEVRGTERLEPRQAYVVVANHESTWDPPVLVAALPKLLIRFVVKRPIMRIPVFGPALRRSGNVTVVRHETEGDIRRVREGMERRHPDVSVLFFAEGTRSRDGALHRFKMGAFASAPIYGLPILPVALAGTGAVLPRGSLQLRVGRVVVELGEPIPTDGLKLEDRAALRDRTYATVRRLRARARARLRELREEPGGID